jgi:hypothetical protein
MMAADGNGERGMDFSITDEIQALRERTKHLAHDEVLPRPGGSVVTGGRSPAQPA